MGAGMLPPWALSPSCPKTCEYSKTAILWDHLSYLCEGVNSGVLSELRPSLSVPLLPLYLEGLQSPGVAPQEMSVWEVNSSRNSQANLKLPPGLVGLRPPRPCHPVGRGGVQREREQRIQQVMLSQAPRGALQQLDWS